MLAQGSSMREYSGVADLGIDFQNHASTFSGKASILILKTHWCWLCMSNIFIMETRPGNHIFSHFKACFCWCFLFVVATIYSIKYIKVSVLSVKKDETGYKVTVGLRNETDKMIRLTNLHEKKTLQFLDIEGFAVFALGPFDDINIPTKTAVKNTFCFPADGVPKTIKIYESEIQINDSVIDIK